MFKKKYIMKLSMFELIFSHICHFFTGMAIGLGITYGIVKLLGL